MGVVTDTHVGDVLPRLPAAVVAALANVDVILHAGDLTVPGVIDQLRQLAPVVAVQGNHDRAAGLRLPRRVLVRVGGVQIGVTHGDRRGVIDPLAVGITILRRRLTTLWLPRMLARRFPGADCVVFGHWHMPMKTVVGRTLVFSPGGAYTREDDRRPVRGVKDRAWRRLRQAAPEGSATAAVGILEVRGSTLTATRIPVPGPLREPASG